MITTENRNIPAVAGTPARSDYYSLLGLFGLLIVVVFSRYVPAARLADLAPWPDAVEYAMSARNLNETGRFTIAINGLELPSRYSLGYPLLIAPFYRLFGPDYANAVYATLVCDLALLGLVYWLGRRIFGRWAGLLAAVFVAGSQGDVFLAKQIMSDLPNSALLLAALVPLTYLGARDWETGAGEEGAGRKNWKALVSSRWWLSIKRDWRLALISGGFFGFACLVRQTNLVYLPWLALFAAVSFQPPASSRQLPAIKPQNHPPSLILHPSALSLFSLGWLLFQIPVVLFNRQTFGGFTRTGYNLWWPAWYDNLSKTFNLDYAFGTDGKAWSYLQILVGLPGSTTSGEKLALYWFPLTLLAVLTLFTTLRAFLKGRKETGKEKTQTQIHLQARFGLLALGMIASSYILYSVYWYKADIRFVHIWLPLIALLAGNGAILAWRWGLGITDWRLSRRASHQPAMSGRPSSSLILHPSSFILLLLVSWLLAGAIGEGWRWNALYQPEQYDYIRLINQSTPSDAVIVTDDIQPIFFSAYQHFSSQRRMMSLAQTRHVMPVSFRFPTVKEQPGLIAELIGQGRPVYYIYTLEEAGQFEKLRQAAAYRLQELERLRSQDTTLVLCRVYQV